MKHKSTLCLAAVTCVWLSCVATPAGAQVSTSALPVDLTIFRTTTGAWLQAQLPFPTNAVVGIQSANRIDRLNTTEADAEDFMLTNASAFGLLLSFSDDSQRFFTASAASVENFEDDPTWDGDGLDRSRFARLLAVGQRTFLIGSPYYVEIATISEAGTGVAVPGTFSFSVVYERDGSAVPDMIVSPNPLSVEDGHFEGYLTVTGNPGIRSDLTLKVEFQQRLSFEPAKANNVPFTTETLIKSLPDSVPSGSENWKHPLGEIGPSIGVSGVFGEWPGHGTPTPHPHEGIDLLAPIDLKVFASRSGTVSLAFGQSVAVKHSSKQYSRYVHAKPRPLRFGEHVEQGQHLATVKKFPRVPVHLHFEITNRPDQNGNAVNPADLIPLLSEADINEPQIKSVLLRSENLADNLAGNRTSPADAALPELVSIGVRARDSDQRSPASVLALRRLEFKPDTGGTLIFDKLDLETVNKHYHDPLTFGYAKLDLDEATKGRDTVWYQYWFPWNLGRSGRGGPARFEISADDAAGNKTSHAFAFGPEILNKSALASVTTRQVTATLRALLGPFPPGQSGVAQLAEIINLKLLSSPAGISGAVFAENNQSTSSIEIGISPLTGQGSKDVAILLPEFTGLPDDTIFALEVRSGRCPTVGDSTQIRPQIQRNRLVVGATLRLNSIAPGLLGWELPATIRMNVTRPQPESRANDVPAPCATIVGFVNILPCGFPAGFPTRAGLPMPEYYHLGFEPNYIGVHTSSTGARVVAIVASVRRSPFPIGGALDSALEFNPYIGYQVLFVGTRASGSSNYTGSMRIGGLRVEETCLSSPQEVTSFNVEILEQ